MAEAVSYAVVIPTIGRASLPDLVRRIVNGPGQPPEEVVVVDDRPYPKPPLPVPVSDRPRVRVLRSGGRGPAAARNRGWQSVTADWVAFVDDDVRLPQDWTRQLVADLSGLDADVAGSQGSLRVPHQSGRPPTDDERRTLALTNAQWISADMAYRRRALMHVGGFDPIFPRAYREDSDCAMRIVDAGYRMSLGNRVVEHPIAPGGFFRSIRVQAGNADDAVMRRRHGENWRAAAGAGAGRMRAHLLAVGSFVAASAGAAAGRRRLAGYAALIGTATIADFAVRRIRPGPRTPVEIAAMAVTSAVIPFAAVAHRLRGEWRARRSLPTEPPDAVLFDRDDTLIRDIPYLSDPDRVQMVPDATESLMRLRRNGIRIGIISNQSGVNRGLISTDSLQRVNARVDELLGPFDTWQVCPHTPEQACRCRKPRPGMVIEAASDLGTSPERCVLVGDIGADVEAALAAGARAVMVPTPRTREEEIQRARRDACVAATITEAVDRILGGRILGGRVVGGRS